MISGFFRYCAVVLFVFGVAKAQEDFLHPELRWNTIETEHFLVHYHEGAERTARVVAKIAEEIYEQITSLYDHEPDQKVNFVIRDHDDYSNGAAYFYDNVIEIWATSMDYDLRGTHNWLRNVVTHEFTHIVQIQTSMKFGRRVPSIYVQWLGYEEERRPDVLYGFPNVVVSYPISGFVLPAWFAEGVAQYNRPELAYDSWDTHRDMILRMHALEGNMLTWEEMAVFGKTSLGNESAYNAGFSFVRYIGERYGEEKIVEISRSLASLTTFTVDDAIQRTLGRRGRDVYNEWRETVVSDYERRSANVKANLVEGEIIADVGFGNFYPSFSPDGKTLAYVSNKKGDYFSPSSLYFYDVETKKEKWIRGGVLSSLSWSPDGKKIYYAKATRRNRHWSSFFDIYVYDLERKKEARLTHGLRARSPAVSPDGDRIAYVAGSDGTLNLFMMDAEGENHFQLTHYEHGEQVYNPRWSPDGRWLVFEYSIKDGRDIAMLSLDGGEVRFLISGDDDSRGPVFTADGGKLVFASDRTGIFNLYEYDMTSGSIRQLTNVLGGSFMPTVNQNGALAYATYTSSGYKIALMESVPPIPVAEKHSYDRSHGGGTALAAANSTLLPDAQWDRLRNYDDTRVPDLASRRYSNVFTSLSIVPFVRVDNYNPKNRGVDVVKPGLYAFSRDVLNKHSMFAGAAMNRKWERDLFAIFEYGDRIPGLFHLGLEPSVSFEVYNITRKTDARGSLGADTLHLNVTYSLLEFDVAFRGKFLTEALDLEVRFAHSRYTSTLEFPPLLQLTNQIIRVDDLYFVGNDLSTTITYSEIARSRTQEINPRGRKIRLRHSYEFSRFNPDNAYEVRDGLVVPLYQRPRFHRLEMNWREHIGLPAWKHTLTANVRAGSILGAPVHDFFDFYIGGLAGMKGFPFYSLGGNEIAVLNLTYRFPISDNIGVRILHLYFDKLYAAVFGDVGNAWTGSVSGQKFKRNVGAELRLESFSWYAYPTRIFFSAAYGLDRFDRFVRHTGTTVTYGKEWRFYFGVLFGFDFD